MTPLRVATVCVLGVLVSVASSGGAHAQSASPDWVVRAEALAGSIGERNLIITDEVRMRQERRIAMLRGVERLQGLYDVAVKAVIDSDEDRARPAIAALEREAAAQRSRRYQLMARAMAAYAPHYRGDHVAAHRSVERVLQGVRDPYVLASGHRMRAYALAELGEYAEALHAAREGMSLLPANERTLSLRAGLHSTYAMVLGRAGDDETALYHLRRSVELGERAGLPVDGDVAIYNVSLYLAQAGEYDAARRVMRVHRALAERSSVPLMGQYSQALCARIELLAGQPGAALPCFDVETLAGTAILRVRLYRLQALSQLGRAREARVALEAMRASARRNSDDALMRRLDVIEPDVLAAEGRTGAAFQAMRELYVSSERSTVERVNGSVRELRAAMENEVAQAEEFADLQRMRAELEQRKAQGFLLTALLAGACLAAALIVMLIVQRSRKRMLDAVSLAESILGQNADAPKGSVSPNNRLASILDAIKTRDVELAQAFAALQAAKATAEEANTAKSHFLMTMSHELRTPLNAIIGYSEILLEDEPEPQPQQDLQRILAAAGRLLGLINDVLDFSKVDAGRMTPQATSFDVGDLLDDAINVVRPGLQCDVQLILDCPDELGAVFTDDLKLGQCLVNLLSNALKFTRAGTVRLSARRHRGSTMDWLEFEVADTGIGISPEAQACLFTPFVQADASVTRIFGGTGLGLAITRRLAQLLGGDVSVRSVLGEGSTFTLRVPAHLGQPAMAAAA